jgi:hypothetical protein
VGFGPTGYANGFGRTIRRVADRSFYVRWIEAGEFREDQFIPEWLVPFTPTEEQVARWLEAEISR